MVRSGWKLVYRYLADNNTPERVFKFVNALPITYAIGYVKTPDFPNTYYTKHVNTVNHVNTITHPTAVRVKTGTHTN